MHISTPQPHPTKPSTNPVPAALGTASPPVQQVAPVPNASIIPAGVPSAAQLQQQRIKWALNTKKSLCDRINAALDTKDFHTQRDLLLQMYSNTEGQNDSTEYKMRILEQLKEIDTKRD